MHNDVAVIGVLILLSRYDALLVRALEKNGCISDLHGGRGCHNFLLLVTIDPHLSTLIRLARHEWLVLRV